MTPRERSDRARTVSRLLQTSGWLELTLGCGHNVVATLLLTRPLAMAPVIAMLGWPPGIAAPIAPPEQLDLVLAMSLGAGTAWMVFGAMLIVHGRRHAAAPDRPLLLCVWAHQASFLILMALFVRFHVAAIVVVAVMVGTLTAALRRVAPEAAA